MEISPVNYCKIINSWNAKCLGYFWNTQAIIYQCFFDLHDCTLTLASDMPVLYGNDAFSVLVLSPKKRYSSFLRKVFLFQKNLFQS